MTDDNTINYAIQTEFTVRFVTDKVNGSQADFYAHDALRSAWRDTLDRFVLEHGNTHGIVAHEPWVNHPEPVVVPANRRRSRNLMHRFHFNSTQILEMWNNSLRFISMGPAFWSDEERNRISLRLRKMRGAVVSVAPHHYRGECAILQEADLEMLLESGILQRINDAVQKAASEALENAVQEQIDSWLDGELEDGLIARIREEEVNRRIDAYFRRLECPTTDSTSAQEPF